MLSPQSVEGIGCPLTRFVRHYARLLIPSSPAYHIHQSLRKAQVVEVNQIYTDYLIELEAPAWEELLDVCLLAARGSRTPDSACPLLPSE